jgi:hypothetical protein
MRKSIASLLLTVIFFVYSQETHSNVIDVKNDSTVFNKNINNSNERKFSSTLKEKYTGKDFEYIEDAPGEKEKPSPIDAGILQFIVFFMSRIFPFLLAVFIIFIILKGFVGFDVHFWKPNKTIKRTKEKLIYEDEDIHKVDFEDLLKKAIDSHNFRLAIRYYYLMTLKGLSAKKIIDYHKDKTNLEYLFEIENTAMRSKFSYLSYVYTYVWYGEFTVDEQSFKAAENKYQSFLNMIL